MTPAQLEEKYLLGLTEPKAYRDTVVIHYIARSQHIAAIAASRVCDGPNDRIYIDSCIFQPTYSLREDQPTPLLKDLLLTEGAANRRFRVHGHASRSRHHLGAPHRRGGSRGQPRPRHERQSGLIEEDV